MDVDSVYIQLLKMGFSRSRIGTVYLAEAVIYFAEHPECDALYKVYRHIGRKHNKKIATVKTHLIEACISASAKTNRNITPMRTINFLVRYNLKKGNT